MATAFDCQKETGIFIFKSFDDQGVPGLQDDLNLFENSFCKAFQNFEELNITPRSKNELIHELQRDLPYKHAVLYFTGIGNIESNKGRKGEVYILLMTMSNEKVYIKDIVQELEKKKFESCHLFFELCLPPSYCDPIPNQVMLPVSDNFVVAISGLNKYKINRKVHVYGEPRVGHWTENLSKYLTKDDLSMTTILDMTWHDTIPDLQQNGETIMLPHYVVSNTCWLHREPAIPDKISMNDEVDPETAVNEMSKIAGEKLSTLDLKKFADKLGLKSRYQSWKVQYNDKHKLLVRILQGKKEETKNHFYYYDLMTTICNVDSDLYTMMESRFQ